MRLTRVLIALVLLLATPRLPQFPSPRLDDLRRPSPAEAQRCQIDLTLARARYSPMPDRELGEGCTQWNAVILTGFAGDERDLRTTGLGAVTCPMARAFYGWASYDVAPAAKLRLGSALARIETYGSYACRNVAGSQRRSGHATANAIDVAAFVLADGRRIDVANGWDSADPPTAAFLRRAHADACRRFGTALGPDYNAAHRDHFHVEISGWRFCR